VGFRLTAAALGLGAAAALGRAAPPPPSITPPVSTVLTPPWYRYLVTSFLVLSIHTRAGAAGVVVVAAGVEAVVDVKGVESEGRGTKAAGAGAGTRRAKAGTGRVAARTGTGTVVVQVGLVESRKSHEDADDADVRLSASLSYAEPHEEGVEERELDGDGEAAVSSVQRENAMEGEMPAGNAARVGVGVGESTLV
jgi:hypothetical protein